MEIVFEARDGEPITTVEDRDELLVNSLMEQVRMMWLKGVSVHRVTRDGNPLLGVAECEFARRSMDP